MANLHDLPPLLNHIRGKATTEPYDDVQGALAAAGLETDVKRGLERALQALGWRARWIPAEGLQLSRVARPDLPLVGIDPEQQTWWLVDRGGMGKVRVRTALWEEPRWVRESDLPEASWARVEPVLPASPWASDPGRPKRPMQRVRGLLRSEWNDVVVVLVYAVLVGVLSLATPIAIQVLINQLAFGVLLQPILFLGLALLVCLTLAAGLQIAKRYVVEVIQRRVFVRAVADLAARFTRVRIDKLDGVYAPELANRYFDVLTLQKATSTLLLDGTTAALQALVGFTLLAFYHPVLLLFDLFAISLVTVVLWPLGWGAERTAIQESKAKYAVAGWLEEIARHPMVFKLGGGVLGEQRADGLTRGYLEARRAHFQVFFRQYSGMQIVNVVLSVVLLVSCGWLVLEGQLTLGQLVAAEFIVASAIAGVSKFTDKLETVYDLLAGIDKLGSLLDLEAEKAGGRYREGRVDGARVALDDVAYNGPGQSLATTNLSVEPGGSLAVVAPAGSGKSTLAELILGVRRPTSGAVLRDGIPTESLAAEELFAEAVLLRSGEVLQRTVEENLLVGRHRSPDVVWSVLEEVGLSDALRSLPERLHTVLDAAGQPLSKGQVSDLLVARALLSGARLVVVDGLFDGLASEHRRRLAAALAARPCTLVVLTEEQEVGALCAEQFRLKGER